jgi:transposase
MLKRNRQKQQRRRKSMSMHPHEFEPIPEETRRVAQIVFRRSSWIIQLRDELGTIYHDEDFRHLFPRRGRPAEAPWRLALVTVLQAAEHLTDRQAADMVRSRIDWKYALSLPLDDPGFDFSVLSAFRARLLSADLIEQLLEPILKLCRSRGWLQPEEQRTDSTHILAAVRDLCNVESVGETFRATLNVLAQLEPSWLAALAPDAWFDRYVDRVDLQRIGKSASKREQWRDQLGIDVWTLLQAVQAPGAPKQVSQHESVQLLARVWSQYFEQSEGEIKWRDGPSVSSAERIVSPYDVDARMSRKRETIWTGYKCHLTETCSRNSDHLRLIVQVHTTAATLQDVEALEPILQEEEQRGLASRRHWVDQGYMSGEHLVQQAQQQRELIGPVAAGQGWQSRVPEGVQVEAFSLDWQARVATCPQGKQSRAWKTRTDRRGKPVEEIRFSIKDCRGCPLRQQCSKSQDHGRILSLPPQEQYEALQKRRAEQESETFRRQYTLRSGVEAALSQGVRRTNLRQSPYRGLPKTHLHHVTIAAALNLVRIQEKLLRDQGRGVAPRSPSPFERLRRVHVN